MRVTCLVTEGGRHLHALESTEVRTRDFQRRQAKQTNRRWGRRTESGRSPHEADKYEGRGQNESAHTILLFRSSDPEILRLRVNLTAALTNGAKFNAVTWSNTTCPDATNNAADGAPATVTSDRPHRARVRAQNVRPGRVA